MVTLTETRGYLLMLNPHSVMNAKAVDNGTLITTKHGTYVVEEKLTDVLGLIVDAKKETRREAESQTHKSNVSPD